MSAQYVGGVSIRSRDGAPSPKGCVVIGQPTGEQEMSTRSPLPWGRFVRVNSTGITRSSACVPVVTGTHAPGRGKKVEWLRGWLRDRYHHCI